MNYLIRYLVPCSHVMASQRNSIKDIDFYSKMARKFLSLIPCCCLQTAAQTLPASAEKKCVVLKLLPSLASTVIQSRFNI